MSEGEKGGNAVTDRRVISPITPFSVFKLIFNNVHVLFSFYFFEVNRYYLAAQIMDHFVFNFHLFRGTKKVWKVSILQQKLECKTQNYT